MPTTRIVLSALLCLALFVFVSDIYSSRPEPHLPPETTQGFGYWVDTSANCHFSMSFEENNCYSMTNLFDMQTRFLLYGLE